MKALKKLRFLLIFAALTVYVAMADTGENLTITIGSDCTASTTCTTVINDTICDESEQTCKCKETFVASKDKTKCFKRPENVGDYCEESEQCQSIQAKCEASECVALDAHKDPAVITRPIPAALAPTPTTEDRAKTSNSEFFKIGETSCANSSNVCNKIKNSHCKEDLCQCKSTYVQTDSRSRCLMKAEKLGDDCEIVIQCDTVNGKCENSKCKPLSEEYRPKSNKFDSTNQEEQRSSDENAGGNASAISFFVALLQFLIMIIA